MWRLANIIPVYKGKGDKINASSYRPISLIDVSYKLLQDLIANQIKSFRLDNWLLCTKIVWLPLTQIRSTITSLVAIDAITAIYLKRSSSS